MVGCKVEFIYNRVMERHELQLPYQLGDIKGLETVAHYEGKDNTIFFVKTLTVADAFKVLNKTDEIKMLAKKREKDPFDEETRFEPDPDGTTNV